MYYDKQIETAKTPLELGQYIDLEMEEYSRGSGSLEIDSGALTLAIRSAIGICRDNPHLNLPDVPGDIVGLQNWCVKAQRVFDKPDTPQHSKPPKMQLSYIRANQSYQDALELGNSQGKVWEGDNREVYNYCRENLEFDYVFPRRYETWQRYRRGYDRIIEAQRQYTDENG